MKLENLSPDELELMSYTDLTYMLLKERKKSMNTPTIFKEICNMLNYTDDDYANKIGDYYTSLTIDKRFILLSNNEWDIRDNHSVEIIMDEDEEETDDIEIEETDEIEAEEELEEDTLYDDESELADDDDDMDDLAIVDEDELEDE